MNVRTRRRTRYSKRSRSRRQRGGSIPGMDWLKSTMFGPPGVCVDGFLTKLGLKPPCSKIASPQSDASPQSASQSQSQSQQSASPQTDDSRNSPMSRNGGFRRRRK